MDQTTPPAEGTPPTEPGHTVPLPPPPPPVVTGPVADALTATATPGDVLRPIAEGERLDTLDAVRGVAILGILLVNIQFFAMPLMEVAQHTALADAFLGERLAWGAVRVLAEYKFISLFSLLFGAGLIVQSVRAEAKGRPFVPLYLRRLAVLAAFGLVHALGLWYGDILLFYAVIGPVLIPVRRLSHRSLAKIGLILVAVSLFIGSTCVGLQAMAGASTVDTDSSAAAVDAGDDPEAVPEPMRGWEAIMVSGVDPQSPVWTEGETRAYAEGPLGDVLIFRTATYGMILISAVFSFGWRIAGLFMIGAALMKSGFFLPAARRRHRRYFVIGVAVGLPLEIGAAAGVAAMDFQPGWFSLVGQFLHDGGSFILCFGYLGGICFVASSAAGHRLLAPVRGIGRLALSVYLAETLLATGVMYWWGLGWFGQVTLVEQLGVVGAIWLAVIAAGLLWLRVFTMGPAEWLWRSLTYGRLQPIRR